MTTTMKLAWQSRRFFASALAAALVGILSSGEARADATTADALFREAKELVSQKRYSEACPKFAESQRLDPSGGTVLHLALCHKEEGRVATAYKELQEAILFAQRDKRDDREKAAKSLAAELLPKLPKLTITVSDEVASISGLTVERDGSPLPSASYGVPVAVDPGEHNVTAKAPGRRVFTMAVTVRGDGAAESVAIPDLAIDPNAPPAVAQASSSADSSKPDAARGGGLSGARKAGLIIGGIGLASIGVGSVFGLQAVAAKSDSASHCNGNICDDEGVALRSKGLTSATVSTAAFIAGGVATAGGLVLVLAGGRSSSPKQSALITSVSVGPSWASVRGQF